MVSIELAQLAGLTVDDAVRQTIRGVNGVAEYPTARARVRVRDQVQVVRVAVVQVAAVCPLLVGLDVIDGLFDAGYVLSRRDAEKNAERERIRADKAHKLSMEEMASAAKEANLCVAMCGRARPAVAAVAPCRPRRTV